MPEDHDIESMDEIGCPSCGTMNDTDASVCYQCGFELGLQDEQLDFEEFDDGAEDEGPETVFMNEDDEMAEVSRGRAREVAGPEMIMDRRRERPSSSQPRGPFRGDPGIASRNRRLPPGPGSPGSRSRSPPLAPAKPARPPKPEDPVKKRETTMSKFTIYLVILGVFNYGLYWAMGPLMGLMKMGEAAFLGYLILDIVVLSIIIVMALYAGRLADKSPDKTTSVERKNLGRVSLGIMMILTIFLIQVFGIHRVLPGVPDPGNYNSQWSLFYIIILLPGVVYLIKGLYGMRERLSYYKIWKNGVWLLVLAPLTGAIDDLSQPVLETGRILNYQWFFASSVASMFIISVFIGFYLKKSLGELFKKLETETKRGEDLFNSGHYREAMEHLDNAIDIGHDLFSQYFYDPENPRLAQQIRLPAQYGIPWLRKGDIYVKMDRPRKAIAIYDVILELDPRNEVVWNRKGEVLMSLEKYPEALRCFDQSLTAVPNYIKAVQNKRRVTLLLRDTVLERS